MLSLLSISFNAPPILALAASIVACVDTSFPILVVLVEWQSFTSVVAAAAAALVGCTVERNEGKGKEMKEQPRRVSVSVCVCMCVFAKSASMCFFFDAILSRSFVCSSVCVCACVKHHCGCLCGRCVLGPKTQTESTQRPKNQFHTGSRKSGIVFIQTNVLFEVTVLLTWPRFLGLCEVFISDRFKGHATTANSSGMTPPNSCGNTVDHKAICTKSP